ncbi:MAG: CO dehydrogenase/CO-methylating acetyl-CoA synthase complex subunit beta, partial [Chloroflexota bacterium]|nr:CO dehydrogenase/CO-methylating acetyl-CoA synthase complex subunit beta [Chloroflexota bacterium]
MSRLIATSAIKGAHGIVEEAERQLEQALKEFGPDKKVAFTNTAYFLPVIYGYMGEKVQTLGEMAPILKYARSLLGPVPKDRMWLPYLGETLDSGVATLFAEEIIEGIRFVRGQQPERISLDGLKVAAPVPSGPAFTSPDEQEKAQADQTKAAVSVDGHYVLNGPIDDIQLRTWGIQLVDGRMPGFAAIVGCAKSNEVAVKIVRELQRRGILIFLSGNVNGRSIIHQLLEEGIQLGYDTYTVPFGTDTISAIYALGFATRSALTFGGLTGGQAREMLLYNKNRVFAFVLALGEVDELKYATAAGAISYGFPVIADTNIPQILPTGITTYEHVVSMPFDEIEGKDDMERAERLVQRCIE